MKNHQTFAFTNPSLVVFNNASYHNVKTEDTVCPNFSQNKAVLQNYLTQHNIPFSATDKKSIGSLTSFNRKPLTCAHINSIWLSSQCRTGVLNTSCPFKLAILSVL
jgi:hypothetical protein